MLGNDFMDMAKVCSRSLRLAGAAALGVVLTSMLGQLDARAATGRLHLDVNGQRRSVTIVEHERLKRAPRTTIIVLHGNSRPNLRGNPPDGRVARRSIGLDEQVRNYGTLLVYPDGLDGRWNYNPGEGKVDDVAFIRALAARLVSAGLADRNRIFVAGVSTGGMMALRVGCDGADFIAGTIALISALTVKQAAECKPGKSLAMMLLNGTANPIVPFGGGPAKLTTGTEDVVSAEATVAPFAQAAGCALTQKPASQAYPDRDPKDGSRILVDRYPGCHSLVELVRVEGGGHTLPGRPSPTDRGVPVGAQNNDANVARLVADFVRRAGR
jgi:polyhydroxybutyrate depolymerase